METLVDKKLARSIGVSNFSAQLLMDLLRYARVRPATLQIEHHPYLTQTRLVNYAQEQGIAVTAYSSFGPLSFIELDLKHAKDTPLLFEHATINSIAEKHGRTPAQVLLRWSTQRNIAVIPKSNDPTRLAQNLQVTDFDLEAGDIEVISALDKGLRFNDPMAVSWTFFVRFVHCADDFSMASAFPFSRPDPQNSIWEHWKPQRVKKALYIMTFTPEINSKSPIPRVE